MSKPVVTDALKAFAAALESVGIAARECEVLMPRESWQLLGQRLDEEGHDEGQDISRIQVASVCYFGRSRSGTWSVADA